MSNHEHERRFLVTKTADEIRMEYRHWEHHITQHYLASGKDCILRVRASEALGDAHITYMLCIKGKDGLEIEKPLDEVQYALLSACAESTISKNRIFVEALEGTYEIDVFEDGNMIAELEYDPHHPPGVLSPTFLGEEITGDENYSNKSLSKNGWPSDELMMASGACPIR